MQSLYKKQVQFLTPVEAQWDSLSSEGSPTQGSGKVLVGHR